MYGGLDELQKEKGRRLHGGREGGRESEEEELHLAKQHMASMKYSDGRVSSIRPAYVRVLFNSSFILQPRFRSCTCRFSSDHESVLSWIWKVVMQTSLREAE